MASRFVFSASALVSADDKEMLLEHYRAKDDLTELLIGGIVILTYGGHQTKLQVSGAFTMDTQHVLTCPNQAPVLLINSTHGGNCWNCRDRFYVIPIRGPNFLRPIGEVIYRPVPEYSDTFSFIWCEDIWEINKWLPHADAPVVPIFLSVTDTAVIKDTTSHLDFYIDQIDQCNSQLRTFAQNVTNASNTARIMENELYGVLQTILAKFLNYRAIGDLETAWREFRSDASLFCSHHSRSSGKGDMLPTRVEEMISWVQTSLEKRSGNTMEPWTLVRIKDSFYVQEP